MGRTETKYNKVVNFDRENNEIIVLSEIFDYGDGFHGATGNIFEPISREEYEEKTSDHELLIEYLMGACDLPDEYKRGGYEEWAKTIEDNDEVADLLYDQSYMSIWDSIREQCGLTEDEAYIFDCRGGGRMFDKDFEGNMNPDLCALIRETETK